MPKSKSILQGEYFAKTCAAWEGVCFAAVGWCLGLQQQKICAGSEILIDGIGFYCAGTNGL